MNRAFFFSVVFCAAVFFQSEGAQAVGVPPKSDEKPFFNCAKLLVAAGVAEDDSFKVDLLRKAILRSSESFQVAVETIAGSESSAFPIKGALELLESILKDRYLDSNLTPETLSYSAQAAAHALKSKDNEKKYVANKILTHLWDRALKTKDVSLDTLKFMCDVWKDNYESNPTQSNRDAATTRYKHLLDAYSSPVLASHILRLVVKLDLEANGRTLQLLKNLVEKAESSEFDIQLGLRDNFNESKIKFAKVLFTLDVLPVDLINRMLLEISAAAAEKRNNYIPGTLDLLSIISDRKSLELSTLEDLSLALNPVARREPSVEVFALVKKLLARNDLTESSLDNLSGLFSGVRNKNIDPLKKETFTLLLEKAFANKDALNRVLYELKNDFPKYLTTEEVFVWIERLSTSDASFTMTKAVLSLVKELSMEDKATAIEYIKNANTPKNTKDFPIDSYLVEVESLLPFLGDGALLNWAWQTWSKDNSNHSRSNQEKIISLAAKSSDPLAFVENLLEAEGKDAVGAALWTVQFIEQNKREYSNIRMLRIFRRIIEYKDSVVWSVDTVVRTTLNIQKRDPATRKVTALILKTALSNPEIAPAQLRDVAREILNDFSLDPEFTALDVIVYHPRTDVHLLKEVASVLLNPKKLDPVNAPSRVESIFKLLRSKLPDFDNEMWEKMGVKQEVWHQSFEDLDKKPE